MSTPTPTPTNIRSYREALDYLASGADKQITIEEAAQCHLLATFTDRHAILGLIIQHAILQNYRRATGDNDVDTPPDWTKIIEWMLNNMPAILQMVLNILHIFGARLD